MWSGDWSGWIGESNRGCGWAILAPSLWVAGWVGDSPGFSSGDRESENVESDDNSENDIGFGALWQAVLPGNSLSALREFVDGRQTCIKKGFGSFEIQSVGATVLVG